VGSVVSVPIIGKSGKVIGVLSLDSTANIADTRFAEPEVVKLLQAYADTLQPVCFFDGVYQSMW
jgi:DNA-binding IclR family transcriptional regulator